jgi:hypothetical protein
LRSCGGGGSGRENTRRAPDPGVAAV